MQPCNANPGWYCSPQNQLIMCPEDWYCPGGASMAIRCPLGTWSAISSAYPEHCLDHNNVYLTILLLLIFAFAAVLYCAYVSSWETLPPARREEQNKIPYQDYSRYAGYQNYGCNWYRVPPIP